MRDVWFVVGSLATVMACGGGSTAGVDASGPGDSSGPGPDQVQGLVNGKAFDARDAVSAQFSQTNGFGFSGPATFVQVSDYAGECALAAQNPLRPAA